MGSLAKRAGRIGMILWGMWAVYGCAMHQNMQTLDILTEEGREKTDVRIGEEEAEEIEEKPEKAEEQETGCSEEEQFRENKERFLKEADRLGMKRCSSDRLFQRLCEDQVFQNGTMELTGLVLDDIDDNGQVDMLVMVLDAEEEPLYGSGSLWIYMNDDEPYCFEEEDCSFYGWFDAFWTDIDNDDHVEIIFSAQGTGCGAAGDSYKVVFKYREHAIERMELPSDLEVDYDCGIKVELVQEPEENRYSAYCSYFDERIFFRGENSKYLDFPDTAQLTGGNVRGFYNLCAAEYEGNKVLQASEYLHGEGGTVHCVAIAQFLITWDKDGTPKVIKWWIEENGEKFP